LQITPTQRTSLLGGISVQPIAGQAAPLLGVKTRQPITLLGVTSVQITAVHHTSRRHSIPKHCMTFHFSSPRTATAAALPDSADSRLRWVLHPPELLVGIIGRRPGTHAALVMV
jgi:hypothetical protein